MAGSHFPRSLLLLLCSLAAVCWPGPARAQDYAGSQVRWRTDYNLARREALEKKLPILIDFYMIPCMYCDMLDSKFFQDPRVAKLINERFIPLKINGKERPNTELAEKLNIGSFPTLVLAAHNGTVLPPAIVGYRDPAALYDHLLRILSSISDPEWMLQGQQQAQKHFQNKEYARAAALLRSIVEDGKTRPVQMTARKMLQELEETGQGYLAQARELLKNRKPDEAIEIANETLRSFPGLQVARDAGGLLSEIMQSAEVRGQQRTKKAQELLAHAQESYKQKDYFVCLDRCETLVKSYGDLPEAQEAYMISANIKSDPQWLRNAGEVLVERLGDVWLALGENFLRGGQPDQARYYFERVLRAFPGTRQAEFAQIRLGQFTNINTRVAPTMMPLPPR
jgi:tetratricopeptide (TPR) repeat protein